MAFKDEDKQRLALLIEFDASKFSDLRRALKAMLRGYGIRLVKIRLPKTDKEEQ